MSERDSVRFGATTIDYSIVRSRRRKKTVEVTIDPGAGVLVAAPMATPRGKIRAVVQKRASWIVRNGATESSKTRSKLWVSGESLPYLGRQVRMFVDYAPVDKAAVRFEHWSFRVTLPRQLRQRDRAGAARDAVRRWYERRARERLRGRVEKWAPLLGVSPTRVLTRDQRQRWGSCSPDGTVRFNWRIVMAEPSLIDYVVVHELAHLVERTHSTKYWQQITRVLPDYKLRRTRLREIGVELSI